jgi:GPH family glycoside/pentoside/hexuronide:cation symporter
MAASEGPLEFRWPQGLRYGLMALPLAFVALPLYVFLPNYYARNFGLPLASLGALLLLARVADALVDPLLGRWIDRLFVRSQAQVLRFSAMAALLLASGFVALFFPPLREHSGLLVWAACALLVCYLGYSALTLVQQSWGALLGGDEALRSRVVAWREGLGLAGVILASMAPLAWGLPITAIILCLALGLGWLAWTAAPAPVLAPAPVRSQVGTGLQVFAPLRYRPFRALLAVFLANGIASALPATLILFFVQDRLQAPPSMEPWFLASYFLAAALAMAPVSGLVARWGLQTLWLASMGLSVAVFAWAGQLGSGDSLPFIAICVLSGLCMAADLTVPGAMLAGLISSQAEPGRDSGIYWGWWNMAAKLNLALAAGLSLPLLSYAGYEPGSRSDEALRSITYAYCVLPCLLKVVAAMLLYFLFIRKKP